MNKVWVLTVFDSGDMETKPWGVYGSEEKALERQEELRNNKELNRDGNNLTVQVSEHIVM